VLKRLAQAGAVLGASAALGGIALLRPGRFHGRRAARALRDLRVADGGGRPPLFVAHGGDPALLVRAAVAALGGMERFVRPGETVLVKPNMAWDRTPGAGREHAP
jgi:hypothetical protein